MGSAFGDGKKADRQKSQAHLPTDYANGFNEWP